MVTFLSKRWLRVLLQDKINIHVMKNTCDYQNIFTFPIIKKFLFTHKCITFEAVCHWSDLITFQFILLSVRWWFNLDGRVWIIGFKHFNFRESFQYYGGGGDEENFMINNFLYAKFDICENKNISVTI